MTTAGVRGRPMAFALVALVVIVAVLWAIWGPG